MKQKWVDNEVYFGPNRRQTGLGKRWGDRRSFDDAAEPPPLGAVLRRLRVHLNEVVPTEDRQYVTDLARFALSEAEKQAKAESARELRAALQLLVSGDVSAADRHVMQAQAALN